MSNAGRLAKTLSTAAAEQTTKATGANKADRLTKDLAQTLAAFGWPPLMPMKVAKRYASCSRWTIQRAVEAGELQVAGKRGRSMVFAREALDRWMLGGPDDFTAPPTSPVNRKPIAALDRIAAIAKGKP